MLSKNIKLYLELLDKNKEPLSGYHGEYVISKKIKDLISENKNNGVDPSKEDIAEQVAFDFLANYKSDNSGWGTYYGPMFILPNEAGQMVEYPSIRKVDQDIISYWEKRAKEVNNPLLSSRYADLVVDFSKEILKKGTDISMYKIVSNSNIVICEENLADPLDCQTKIKRALSLAIQISDSDLIEKIKKIIIKLEEKTAVDESPGLWGFSFKWLLLDFKDKVSLSDIEKDNLLSDLEKRLNKVESDSWLTENVVSLLAEYYSNQKDEANLMRVLNKLEQSLKNDSRTNSDALLKIHAFEKIHEIYRKYASRFPESEKANKRLSQEIGNLDLDWNKSLKEISVETQIKQEDIDAFLKSIFDEQKDDSIVKTMAKIALSGLPKKDAVKKQLDDISSKHPLQFLMTSQIISDDGVPIAKLSNLEEDYDNHFQSYASQYIQFGSYFLSLTMDELKRRFSKQSVIDYFYNATLFSAENKEYLKRALSAYWDNDYLVASHLFNPLIETAVRELIKKCGGLILTPNTVGGYDYVLLHKLLKNDEIFERVFSISGHNVVFYLRLILTEKLGMNLRNDFAHGIGKNKFFGRNVSDRLFHIMILLTLVIEKK